MKNKIEWVKNLVGLLVFCIACFSVYNFSEIVVKGVLNIFLSLCFFNVTHLDGKICKYKNKNFNCIINKISTNRIINIYCFFLILGWIFLINYISENITYIYSGLIIKTSLILNCIFFLVIIIIKFFDLLTINHKYSLFTINYMVFNILTLMLLIDLQHGLSSINQLSAQLFMILMLYLFGVILHILIDFIYTKLLATN